MFYERRVSPWEFIAAILFAAVLPTLELVGVVLDFFRHTWLTNA